MTNVEKSEKKFESKMSYFNDKIEKEMEEKNHSPKLTMEDVQMDLDKEEEEVQLSEEEKIFFTIVNLFLILAQTL